MSLIFLAATLPGSSPGPAPLAPTPSPRQTAWRGLERYLFCHFGPNTFTDKEWGGGNEDPNLFNPTDLDCLQWAKAAKSAGFAGIVITAKHHDGFCLWPSKFSTHTVAQSSWRAGKGDVLADLSKACRKVGIKMGVYLSPWDRNHPAYGTPAYNQVFASMLREVLGNYGPIFEVWFDGANGEGPNGKKQVYDWPLFIRTVRKYQPNAVIFSDAGPDIRWIGNEEGIAGETNWALVDRSRYSPGHASTEELNHGYPDGRDYVPGECDVSIRPGWFYHPEENDKVKSVSQLMSIYERSVGRNANLILNVPPDRAGRFNDADLRALDGFGKAIAKTYGKDLALRSAASSSADRGRGFQASRAVDGNPATYWAAPDGKLSGGVELAFAKPVTFDRVMLQEYDPLGQRIAAFHVEAEVEGEWRRIGGGTTIGYKRILEVPETTATKLRVTIDESRACPTLAHIGLYLSPRS